MHQIEVLSQTQMLSGIIILSGGFTFGLLLRMVLVVASVVLKKLIRQPLCQTATCIFILRL